MNSLLKILIAIFLSTGIEALAEVQGPMITGDYSVLLTFVLTEAREIEASSIKLEQAKDRVQQSGGHFLPVVNLVYTATRKEEANSVALGGMGGNIPTEQLTTSVTKIQATQNIYNGFQDRARWSQRRLEVEQAAKDLAAVKLNQSLQFTKSFFKVVTLQHDIRNLTDDIRVQNERLEEVRKRLRLGLARSSDVSTIQVASLNSMSSLALADSDLESEWLNLESIVGHPLEHKTLTFPDLKAAHDSKRLIAHWENHPDLQSSRLAVEIQRTSYTQTKSQVRPTVDLTANSYLNRTGNINNNAQWDATLTVSIPWPWGIEKRGAVAESHRAVHVKDAEAQQKANQVKSEVETLVRGLASSESRLQIAIESVSVQIKNEVVQRAEFAKGLVSAADYLNTLLTLQSSARTKDQLKVDVISKRFQLNIYIQSLGEE